MNSETDHANTSIDDDMDGTTENKDIYAFFNLNKNATKEDINQAYRRLSIIYHPDKHSNPALKLKAEKMFNKINRYYSILSDDQKRQLYDFNIFPSIDDLSQLQVTPFVDPITGQPVANNQIKAEYERLVEKAERERIMARTNPQGTISLTLDCCDLFRPYSRVLIYNPAIHMVAQSEPNRYPEFKRLNIGQSVECPCGANDRLILGGNLRSENGLGSGVMSVLWRHVMGRSVWSETTFALGDQPSVDFGIYGPLVNKVHGFGSFRLHFANASSFPAVNTSFGISKQLDKHLLGVISTGFNVDLENLSDFESLLSSLYVNSVLTYDDQRSKRIIGSVRIGADESHFHISTLYRFRDENESKIKLVFEWVNVLPYESLCLFKFDEGVGSMLKIELFLDQDLLGTAGALSQLGYERKISEQNTFGCSCLVHWPQCSLSLKLRLKRANQTFALNFLICDEELYTKAIFYGIVVPAAIYNASKWCYKVYMQKMGQKLHLESLERRKLEIEIKKKGASTTIQLMTPYASRIKENEEKINGLIIVDAKYGSPLSLNDDQNSTDVTIPLQAMVKDSRLILQKSSKACLAGFYDPCPNSDKVLKINYRFNESLYDVQINDEEGLDLPNTRHKIDEPYISGPKVDSSGFVDDNFATRTQQSLYED